MLHRDVMDKEPSLAILWLTLGGITLFGFWFGRRWPSRALIVLPLAVVWIGALLGEVWDPWLGPAIRREAGVSYVAQVYLLSALALLAPFAGMIWKRLRSGGPEQGRS